MEGNNDSASNLYNIGLLGTVISVIRLMNSNVEEVEKVEVCRILLWKLAKSFLTKYKGP